ncbi:hypothetical protein C823_007717 [Eubacterium plexicaudatum ASF492]|nr:hypothetical protein C823_007717 [Eubacterium plexicaudatum ASF492]
MPFKSMKNKVSEFLENKENIILFLHIREPYEIARAVEEFKAKTILIVRDSVNQITSNISDKNVFNYNYDYIIYNNKNLLDLRIEAKNLLHKIS